MLTILVLIFLTAIICPTIDRVFKNSSAYLCATSLLGAFIFFAQQISGVQNGSIMESYTWSEQFGVNISFALDGLSLVMSLLITGIGVGVFIYSGSYMKAYAAKPSFFSALMIFTGSMLGLVLSDNVILMFIFWEMTSLTSFLLIGFKQEKESVRDSARVAMFLTAGGGLFMLVGLVLLSMAGQSLGLSLNDSLSFSELRNLDIKSHSLYAAILGLIAIGAATKSAQFPFHFWLPLAMAGPTPVSSFLHSATMVKAGVYLLARLFPSLGGTGLWMGLFISMGLATAVLGAVLAAGQRDMKKVLAYTTISVLGTLVMLLGIGSELAIKAAVVYLVAHALYKAALFQVVGNIDKITDDRDIQKNSQLVKYIPLTAATALLAAFSMSGIPPLFGFIGKELSYASLASLETAGFALLALVILANALIVGFALGIAAFPFWPQTHRITQTQTTQGSEQDPQLQKNKFDQSKSYKSLPLGMSLPPFTFAFVGLVFGVFPSLFDSSLGSSMVSSIRWFPTEMKLSLWHGFSAEALTILLLSLLTLALGVFVALRLEPTIKFFSKVQMSAPWGSFASLYESLLGRTLYLAQTLTGQMQNGSLVWYLRLALIGVVVLVGIPAASLIALPFAFEFDAFRLVLALFIGLPLVGSLLSQSRLVQIVMTGASGFALVVAFTLYSAIDLAMTQLMVESLSIIFIFFLVQAVDRKGRVRLLQPTNVAISLIVTILLALILLPVTTELPQSVSDFYRANALSQAKGQNIVNVILVDFRALDTFGEAVVVGIAAIGVGALLSRSFRGGQIE